MMKPRISLFAEHERESSSIPDAKTIWLFRDRLAQAGAGTLVFEQVQQQLHQYGADLPTGTKMYHHKLKRDITERLRRDIRRRSASNRPSGI